MASLVDALLPQSWRKPRILLKTLKPDDDILDEIHRKFKSICGSFIMKSFYETVPAPGVGLVNMDPSPNAW